MENRYWRSWLARIVLLGLAVGLTPSLQAASNPSTLPAKYDPIWEEAQTYEAQGKWDEAYKLYYKLRKLNPGCEELNKAFLDCLAHLNQGLRLEDEAFRKRVLKLKPAAALKVYEEVVVQLRANYLDRERVDLCDLFQRGLAELRFALINSRFQAEFLDGTPKEAIDKFQKRLADWPISKGGFANEKDTSSQVQRVAREAANDLGLSPTAVVVEFAFGACNALDEYTFGLTPRQLNSLQSTIKGKSVDLGVRLASSTDQKLEVARVYSENPALSEIKKGDRLIKIDGIPVDGFSADTAEAFLAGEEGSAVEVEILPAGETKPRRLTLPRTSALRSVKDARMLSDEVGYLKVTLFQESTVQEMKSAILGLQGRGMKALVLDLRGNPGGLFDAGVQAAELFLSDNVIVYTVGRIKQETHKANNTNPLNLPVLVLVDNETASAAEVLAGALKENGKAKVAGQTTYGKGTIQCVIPLEKFPAGLRVTVAKFLSPANYPYTGHGVIPDFPLEKIDLEDAALVRVHLLARSLITGMPMNMGMD
ncbi:MAG: S41 family peptidase [Gemmataceae bacterium]